MGDGELDSARVVTTDDIEEFSRFMHLEDIGTGEAAVIPEDGVLISRNCAEEYGLTVGSEIELLRDDGTYGTFRVTGVAEHFLIYYMSVTTGAHY